MESKEVLMLLCRQIYLPIMSKYWLFNRRNIGITYGKFKEYEDTLEYGLVYTESRNYTPPFEVGLCLDGKVYKVTKTCLKKISAYKFFKDRDIRYCLPLYLSVADYQMIHYRLDKLDRNYNRYSRKYKYMFRNSEYLFTNLVFDSPRSSQEVAKAVIQKIIE